MAYIKGEASSWAASQSNREDKSSLPTAFHLQVSKSVEELDRSEESSAGSFERMSSQLRGDEKFAYFFAYLCHCFMN